MEYKLNLFDPVFDRTYEITLGEEDYYKASKDQAYATVLLKHARECFEESKPSKLSNSSDTQKEISRNNQSDPADDSLPIPSTSTSTPERTAWTRKEILLLIELYEENQDLFKSTTTRKEVFWGDISNKLNKLMNCNKSGDQCRNKFKYLKTMYLKKKDNMSKKSTGSQNLNFAYFSEMDAIFKKDHNVTPVATVSSLNNKFPEEKSDKTDEDTTDDENKNKLGPTKKSKLLKKKKEKPVFQILSEREANMERRHQENLQKKNEALDVCRQILNLAQNIVETKK